MSVDPGTGPAGEDSGPAGEDSGPAGEDSGREGAGPAGEGWRPMKSGPMPAGLGVPWSKRDGGAWRYGLATGKGHGNSRGAVHGGVLTAFADHGLSLLAWEAAGRVPCATIQLNAHFLAAVRPGDFVALVGEVTRATRGLVFVRGLLSVGARHVAAVDGVWRVSAPAGEPRRRTAAAGEAPTGRG